MPSVSFYLKDKNKPGERPINVRIRHNGDRLDSASLVGAKIALKDLKNGKLSGPDSIKGATQKMLDLKDRIAQLQYLIENKIPRVLRDENSKIPSIAEIHERVKIEIGLVTPELSPEDRKKELSFFEVFDEYLNHYRTTKKVAAITIVRRELTKDILEEYAKKRNKTLSFDKINMNFYNDFVYFLGHEYKLKGPQYKNKDKVGMADNTVGSHINNLKLFLNWANDEEYTNSKGHKDKGFKRTNIPADIVVFSEEELHKILALDFKDQTLKSRLSKEELKKLEFEDLEIVRDYLIAGCFTGQRISDLMQIPPTTVYLKSEEDSFIKVIPHKTQRKGRSLEIPLAPILFNVFKEHRGKYNYALPTHFRPGKKVLKQQINVGLKLISKLADINASEEKIYIRRGEVERHDKERYELFSAHRMRATFITTMLNSGANPAFVMEIVGISNWSSFQRYIKFVDDNKKKVIHKGFGDYKKLG